MMLSTAACASFESRDENLIAVCDAWRATIPVTVRDDRRALREQELLARETQREVCP